MIAWLASNAIAATLLAVFVGGICWCFQPRPAIRHALWLVVMLRLVSPTGLVVEIPLPFEWNSTTVTDTVEWTILLESEEEESPVSNDYVAVQVGPDMTQREYAQAALLPLTDASMAGARAPSKTIPAIQTRLPKAASSPLGVSRLGLKLGLVVWVAGSLICLLVMIRQTRRFAWFSRQSVTAPTWLTDEVTTVARRLGLLQIPAIRVLPGLSSPVMWCLTRPMLLWPVGLEHRLPSAGRQAIIAHELAHLVRRDHWVRRLEMLVMVLYWWNPVFWWARRRIRTNAEMACDCLALDSRNPRVYAEALLEVCAFQPRHRPAPAVGIVGDHRREMKDRLTMIMTSPTSPTSGRLAFGAKLFVVLVALASLPALTLGQSKVNDAAVAEIKAIELKIEALKKQLEEMRAKTKPEMKPDIKPIIKPEIKPDVVKVIRDVVVEAAKIDGVPKLKILTDQEGINVIGADGKEIKDVKVMVTMIPPLSGNVTTKAAEVLKLQGSTIAPVNAAITARIDNDNGQSVMLTRTTWKLSKDQIVSLQTLLGSIKGGVMETKVEGDNITITTTPDRMMTVSSFVSLVTGQKTPTSGTMSIKLSTTDSKELKENTKKPDMKKPEGK